MSIFAKLLKPRVPRIIGADAKAGLSVLKTLFAADRPLCPHCRQGRLQLVADRPDMRVCDNCETSFTIQEIAGFSKAVHYAPKVVIDRKRAEAEQLLLIGSLIVIFGAFWSVYTTEWTTLVGALILNIPIQGAGVVARYRAWQVETNRLFLQKSPFPQYVNEKIAGIFTKPQNSGPKVEYQVHGEPGIRPAESETDDD